MPGPSHRISLDPSAATVAAKPAPTGRAAKPSDDFKINNIFIIPNIANFSSLVDLVKIISLARANSGIKWTFYAGLVPRYPLLTPLGTFLSATSWSKIVILSVTSGCDSYATISVFTFSTDSTLKY